MAEFGEIFSREIIAIDKNRYIGFNCPSNTFKSDLLAAITKSGYNGFTDFFLDMSRRLMEDVKLKEAEHNGQPTDGR